MPDQKIDSAAMPPKMWTTAFGTYLILLNLILIYLILRLWPGVTPSPEVPTRIVIVPNCYSLLVWPEARYLALVALIGALGSYIHLATSFADYLGNRQFVSSWEWWYVLRPFIGAALALLMYFAARGGLISGTSGAQNLSPYGIAALAGLSGLFSKQATDKLRETFENLLKTTPVDRKDSLNKDSNGADSPENQ